ncbi:ABC transporter permease [Ramlibacter sp.]|uniref:ABC transporter permease n=1 Tax=Ramlibacter sp. TaxID=1917967 RepID=UPI002C50B56F|nr:ABC transporter permease [Ramlibacter sp.]HWI84223.1 ABC transporter permease [Ramlibacter sp.]
MTSAELPADPLVAATGGPAPAEPELAAVPPPPLWRRLARHRLFMTGAVILALMLAMALLADLIQLLPPEKMRVRLRFRTPGWDYPLGTDNYGRDIWSRIVHGARLSLAIGSAVALVTAVAGTVIGVLAGYYRRLDDPLMRLMDALMSFPAILLAIAIAAALGPSAGNAVIALAIVYTPRMARIARSTVMVVREMDYVKAARACGARDRWIIWRHVLPNSMPPLLVQLTFVFAYAILAEAILSFLGVGPPPPTPTWGNMIAEGKDYLREAPHICLFPGIAVALVCLALNLLGDGLRDVLDPRLRVQHG